MTNEIITVTELICVTYQANTATLPYHFVGKTKEEAEQKLQEFLNKKKEVVIIKTDDEKETLSGRGVANTGKVWMISKEKQERLRVPAEEVGKFLNLGYIKGGPRTSF